MSLTVFYSIVIILIGIQIKSISFLLRSFHEMICLVLVVMSKTFAATTGQRKRCRVKQVLFDHLYSMIGILNDLECDIKTTLQTPDCVWWDLIHEYNRKTFPLFKKHVTKQDKHAQSTSIAHVEVLLFYIRFVPKLTFKKIRYSCNCKTKSSLESMAYLFTNNKQHQNVENSLHGWLHFRVLFFGFIDNIALNVV